MTKHFMHNKTAEFKEQLRKSKQVSGNSAARCNKSLAQQRRLSRGHYEECTGETGVGIEGGAISVCGAGAQ